MPRIMNATGTPSTPEQRSAGMFDVSLEFDRQIRKAFDFDYAPSEMDITHAAIVFVGTVHAARMKLEYDLEDLLVAIDPPAFMARAVEDRLMADGWQIVYLVHAVRIEKSDDPELGPIEVPVRYHARWYRV